MTTQLQRAIDAIRNDDKSTGKSYLLDVLKRDPENDQAWVWMSAVVETDDMRQGCLEEALKCNPDNKMARRGLEKLQQITGRSSDMALTGRNVQDAFPQTETDPQPFPTGSSTTLSQGSRATIEYFCKRLMIEKGYQILLPEEDAPIPVVNPDNFLARILVTVVPELLPLRSHFDVVLCRQTGARFDAICLKVCRDKGEPAPVPQAKLIEVGQACLGYSNVVAYGQVMPVMIQVWEIFERAFTAEDEQRLSALMKRMPGRKKVAIHTHAIDLISKRILHSSTWFKVSGPRRYIRRLIDEESSFSEREVLTELVNSRIEFIPILAGIVTGVVLGLGLRLIAGTRGWRYDLTFDAFIVFVSASIAVYLPKFKLYSPWQGVLAAAGFGTVLYGILLFLLNYEPSIWYGINLVIIVLLGRFIGVIAEP